MKRFVSLGLAIALLALGCEDLFHHPPNNEAKPVIQAETQDSGAAKAASVHITVANPAPASKAGVAARGMTVAFVTVTASRSGNADIVANLTYNASTNTSSGDMTGLALGQWTFLGQATDASGNLLYSGQTIYSVVSGTNMINMNLYENIGAIKVVAGWELAGGFSELRVTATRSTFPNSQNTESVAAQVTSGFSYLINLNAGDWSVLAEGYENGVCYFRSAATTVTVAQNVVTSQNIGLQQIKVTPVTATPAPDTFPTAQNVDLSTKTSGAAVYYRSDGVDPGADLATAQATATLYSSPIAVGQNTSIRARAYLTGVDPSDRADLDYYIQAEAPVFNVASGTYSSDQTVAITTTLTGATIVYTTDNSVPTASNGTSYSAPVSISGDASGQTEVTTHLKAIVIKAGCAESPPTSADYTITGTVATPTMTPLAGSYGSAQTVTLSTTTPSATIKYTVDGSDPATSQTAATYASPFQISHNTTVQAIGTRNNWSSSGMASTVYTLDLAYTTLSSASPITGALTGYKKMTLANSPYHIGANAAVDSSAILFIEPGVTVRFDGYYYLRVDGTMIANGTSGSHIVFTSDTGTNEGSWDKINLTTATTEISYCDFNYAFQAIYSYYSDHPASIDHCVFSNNHNAIFVGTNSKEEFLISACIFATNGWYLNGSAVWIAGTSKKLLDLCSFSGNRWGMEVESSSYVLPMALNLRRCQFNTNEIGIYARNYLSADIRECGFQDNTSAGIYFALDPNPDIMLPIITNCDFYDTAAIVNGCQKNIDLGSNYWGTTDEATIQDMISDFYDNISYGKINYTPWLTQAVTW